MKSITIAEYLKLNVDLSPSYQRGTVWSPGNKASFVEHVVETGFFPPIHLREVASGKYECLDGKQRSLALREFIEGKKYAALSDEAKEKFQSIEVPILVYQGLSNEKAVRVFQSLQKGTRLSSAEYLLAAPSKAREAAEELAKHSVWEYAAFRTHRKDIEHLCLRLLMGELETVKPTAATLERFVSKYRETPIPEEATTTVRRKLDAVAKLGEMKGPMNKSALLARYEDAA